jgi:hypothetical protein
VAALQDGLLRVLQKVQEHLLQLAEVPGDVWNGAPFFHDQADRGARKCRPHQVGRAVHEFVERNRLPGTAPVARKLQHLPEDSAGAFRFREQSAQLAARGPGAAGLTLQQPLRIAQNRRQRIA